MQRNCKFKNCVENKSILVDSEKNWEKIVSLETQWQIGQKVKTMVWNKQMHSWHILSIFECNGE